MTIALIDGKPRRTELVKALSTAAPKDSVVYAHGAGRGDWSPAALPEKMDLVLFHWNDRESLALPAIAAPVGRSAVRIFFSGAGMAETTSLPEHWLGIPRPLDAAEDLSPGEWRELLTWATDPQRTTDYLPRALQRDFPRAATALLILAQGFRAITGGQVKASPKAGDRILQREWWAEPFRPLLASSRLQGVLRKEFGFPQPEPSQADRMPQAVVFLVRWIEQDDSEKAAEVLREWAKEPAAKCAKLSKGEELLSSLVESAEKELAKLLGSK
jgi:hypothetical protein